MILIAGCGYVGEALADLIDESAMPVMALTHSVASATALGERKPYPVIACDLSDAKAVAALPAQCAREGEAPPAAIVHCASSGRGGADAYQRVYVDGCAHLRATFPEAHLVFTSSTSVYPQTDGSWVDEQSPAEPERKTGRLLRAAEALVLEGQGTVTRLAGIYGSGRSVLLKRFLEGASVIDGDPTHKNTAGRYLNQIHRDDIVDAIAHLLLFCGDDARGEIYNLADTYPLTQRACYTALGERFERPLPPVHPPDPNRKRGWTNKQVSNKKLRATGWDPAYPSYLDAITDDATLVSSIVKQVERTS